MSVFHTTITKTIRLGIRRCTTPMRQAVIPLNKGPYQHLYIYKYHSRIIFYKDFYCRYCHALSQSQIDLLDSQSPRWYRGRPRQSTIVFGPELHILTHSTSFRPSSPRLQLYVNGSVWDGHVFVFLEDSKPFTGRSAFHGSVQ